MANLFSAVIFTLIVLFVVSCTSSVETPTALDCSANPPADNTYTKQIKAIIDGTCATAGCHTANSRAGGIALNTYATVKNSFVSGKGLCSVKHTCVPMPQGGGKLPVATINRIECWINSGAPE